MKIIAYFTGLLGLLAATALVVQEGYYATIGAMARAGPGLLWLVAYRLLYFLLYAIAWQVLIRPNDPQRRANLPFLFWVATVREGVDRLLPVASVGGGVVGVRLVVLRGLRAPAVAASVIIEILMTLLDLYLFAALGLLLLVALTTPGTELVALILGFALSLPVPVATVLLLRYGSMFERLQNFIKRLIGDRGQFGDPAALDGEIRALFRRRRDLLASAAWQFFALLMSSFEVWFALQLLGHPVGVGASIALESLTQAARHLAFFVPAGLGVQEGALILFGQMFGLGSDVAVALSLAKRMREVICGVPALASWQWAEGRRLHASIAARRAQ